MTSRTEQLGGRLPLLDPQALSAVQQEISDSINATFGSWADRVHFQSKTEDGRLIGPFNPILCSPDISAGFLDLHDAEEKYSSLDERVRQVVILYSSTLRAFGERGVVDLTYLIGMYHIVRGLLNTFDIPAAG
jgi:4-carboxymuconolactone decarboxylase